MGPAHLSMEVCWAISPLAADWPRSTSPQRGLWRCFAFHQRTDRPSLLQGLRTACDLPLRAIRKPPIGSGTATAAQHPRRDAQAALRFPRKGCKLPHSFRQAVNRASLPYSDRALRRASFYNALPMRQSAISALDDQRRASAYVWPRCASPLRPLIQRSRTGSRYRYQPRLIHTTPRYLMRRIAPPARRLVCLRRP